MPLVAEERRDLILRAEGHTEEGSLLRSKVIGVDAQTARFRVEEGDGLVRPGRRLRPYE